ncbi:N-acetyltransferase [Reticulibacter mediterranei]|uniref:N-acetyltransferase n=1 Tax=Reticulibacter mediterranei TaxID=2778369 RepID=A0A8J3N5P1_9CHLR|nr:GNAT family N-acetyltransferase [Reticulibacter mediterranei]GHO99294.1 N-acetyltransferase [Reticulibacter mediterranei]
MLYLDVRKNFEEKVSYVARHVNGMMVDEQASYLTVDCGVPSDTFNVIVVRGASLSTQLLASIERFTTRGIPFALWYWENAIDAASNTTLMQQGLSHVETHTAMTADLSQVQLTSRHLEGLEIRQVTTAHELQQFGEVITALFGASREGRQVAVYFQQVCAYPLSMFPAMRYYLGIFHGTVVATGTLFVGSQTAGIYDVVTHDQYRRRGIGSIIFHHLLKEAITTSRRYAVLQASKDGLGIYIRAGFQATGDVLTFEQNGEGGS